MAPRQYGALDRFRLLAVLLVIANHTGPLLSVNVTANYLITDILARLAVPFFLTVSGYFLLPRLAEEGTAALVPFLKKLGGYYALATLLYLPLQIHAGYFSQPGWPAALVRDLLFDGTYYHLWYFPAAMVGACVVCLLVRCLPRLALPLCILLYLVGLLGDSYYGLTAALPPLRGVYDALFTCFDQTRNGLFLAPIYLLLGGLLAQREPRRPHPAALPFALVLLLAEGLALRGLTWPRYDAMYLLLPLCLWLLMGQLLTRPGAPLPWLRRICLAAYVLHPLCVIGVRGAARLLGLRWLLVACSPVYYLAVTLSAALLALAAAPLLPRPRSHTPCRAWTELDSRALRHNIAALEDLLPPACALMAVIKADGYGHGALALARMCHQSGVDAFAVATAAEGVQLRRAGVGGTILVLGYTPPEQAPLLSRFRLTQSVVSLDHALALEEAGRRVRVHLKLDTGMHRLGIPWDDFEAQARVYQCRHLRVEGVFTHLADAEALDPVDEARTQLQIKRFYAAVSTLNRHNLPAGQQHILSTYGLLNYGPLPCSYVRVGIALCGVLSRAEDVTRTLPDLRPVLSLRARVAQIHTLSPGERAGYDGSFVADGPCRVALVTIGYADGYPRSLSRGEGHVLIRGQRAPVAGLICMDQLLVDVTLIPEAAPGDVVTLIGRDGQAEITAGEVAQAAGTITNEIFSRLGPRLERVIL